MLESATVVFKECNGIVVPWFESAPLDGIQRKAEGTFRRQFYQESIVRHPFRSGFRRLLRCTYRLRIESILNPPYDVFPRSISKFALSEGMVLDTMCCSTSFWS